MKKLLGKIAGLESDGEDDDDDDEVFCFFFIFFIYVRSM